MLCVVNVWVRWVERTSLRLIRNGWDALRGRDRKLTLAFPAVGREVYPPVFADFHHRFPASRALAIALQPVEVRRADFDVLVRS